jgi:hypothetical protein
MYLAIHGNIETGLIHGASSQSRQKCFSFNVPFNDSPDVNVLIEIFDPRSKSESDKKARRSTASISDYELEHVSIKSSCEAEVSEDLLNALQSGINAESKLPNITLQEELKRLDHGMRNATNQALHLIKYGLHFSNISESPFSGSSLHWSADGSEWKYISLTIHLQGSIDREEVKLDTETATQIQRYIDTSFAPFFALAPLHRAKNEHDPRYKIIYAAYAAELAIKEFLIEYAKKDGYFPVEPLLLELPSPPLGKLYGEVLKFYTKKGSPKVDEMVALNKERNSLMHRPPQKEGEKEIELAKAEKYVRDAEGAIFHLLYLLYEKDPLIERLYKKYNKKRKGGKSERAKFIEQGHALDVTSTT